MFNLSVSVTVDQGGAAGDQSALQFYQACNGVPGTQTIAGDSGYWDGACWNGTHAGTLNFNAYNHFNTPNKWSCIAANTAEGNANSVARGAMRLPRRAIIPAESTWPFAMALFTSSRTASASAPGGRSEAGTREKS